MVDDVFIDVSDVRLWMEIVLVSKLGDDLVNKMF